MVIHPVVSYKYLHASPICMPSYGGDTTKIEKCNTHTHTHTHSFSLTQLHKTRTTISLLSICSITLLSKNVLIFLEREKFELCPKPRERTHTHTHTHTLQLVCVRSVLVDYFFLKLRIGESKRGEQVINYIIYSTFFVCNNSQAFFGRDLHPILVWFSSCECVYPFQLSGFFLVPSFIFFFFARWGTQSRI